MKTDGCAFCTHAGHRVRGCPAAFEYVRSGRVVVKNDRLTLPSGQPIPNDGSSKGLKHGIDTWLAANSTNLSEPVKTPQVPVTATLQCDSPPHSTLALEIIQSEDLNDASRGSDNDSLGGELYDIHEVLAAVAKDRRHEVMPPSANPPNTSNAQTHQFHYQSNAEDQKLTSQLFTMLLEGNLTLTTPAHILAASAPI